MRLGTLLLFVLLTTSIQADPLLDLRPVGAARLKVLLWAIYDSSLYSDDGEYRGVTPGLALRIDYRRNIPAARLISQTRKEWQRLSLYGPQSESWLASLADLWPDVRRGDSLVLRVNGDLGSDFFLNEELLGTVADPDFGADFLAIWLSDRSSYPDLSRQLRGNQAP